MAYLLVGSLGLLLWAQLRASSSSEDASGTEGPVGAARPDSMGRFL